MNDLLFVRKENHDLRAAHEKEKQKRQKSKKQIPIEQGITREEAQALVQGQIEASQAGPTAPAEPELPASQTVEVAAYALGIMVGNPVPHVPVHASFCSPGAEAPSHKIDIPTLSFVYGSCLNLCSARS
uniref:Uncharacterized protein n=1 Tax=Talaromyces marneffei PM1 TaxID=1077442 RepID=A0A093V4F6_TALMA